MSKVFVDTNLLIYCLDSRDKKKQKQARQCLKKNEDEAQVVISTQILQEFYVASTKKLGVEPLEAKSLMKSFLNFEVITVTHELIADAIDCSLLNKLSFWDALVVVTAESAKCVELLTEDLNHGQVIQGIQIHNPFL